jgi:hypothetical protein
MKAEKKGPPWPFRGHKTPYKFKKSYGGTPEPQTAQGCTLAARTLKIPYFLALFFFKRKTQAAMVAEVPCNLTPRHPLVRSYIICPAMRVRHGNRLESRIESIFVPNSHSGADYLNLAPECGGPRSLQVEPIQF